MLKDCFSHYRQHVERFSKTTTKTDYIKRLERLERYAKKNNYIEFSDTFFLRFLDHLYLERKVSARTYNNYRTWCYGFCMWLWQHQFIENNPIENIKTLREPPKFRQPLPTPVLKQVREYLLNRNRHFLLAVMMEYYTFIRPGELSNIRIRDIDVVSQTIYISDEISKNGKAERVGLNDAILSLMSDLDVLSKHKDWYLFSNRCRPGKAKLEPRMFRDRWVRLRKRLNLPKEYQFYSLKDSGIRDLANSAGIIIARDQARHSSVAVTNKYLQGRDRPVHTETIHFKGAL